MDVFLKYLLIICVRNVYNIPEIADRTRILLGPCSTVGGALQTALVRATS